MLPDCGGGLVFNVQHCIKLESGNREQAIEAVQHVTDITSIVLGKVI